jgi:hypothetical protein
MEEHRKVNDQCLIIHPIPAGKALHFELDRKSDHVIH